MPDTAVILAVDHNRRNLDLLTHFLGQAGYQTRIASSLAQFDQALAQADDLGLALVDIAGFDRSIWERCQRLREQKIPSRRSSPDVYRILSPTSAPATPGSRSPGNLPTSVPTSPC